MSARDATGDGNDSFCCSLNWSWKFLPGCERLGVNSCSETLGLVPSLGLGFQSESILLYPRAFPFVTAQHSSNPKQLKARSSTVKICGKSSRSGLVFRHFLPVFCMKSGALWRDVSETWCYKVSMGWYEKLEDGLGRESTAHQYGHAHKVLILSGVGQWHVQHALYVLLLHQGDFGPQPSHLTWLSAPALVKHHSHP